MKLHRSFWIALVLFLALAGYVRYYESRRPVETGPAVIPFLAVESTRLSGITVAFARDTTHMERRDGSWWITKPVDFPADPIAVEALLSRCRGLEVLRRFVMDPDQKQSYGLDHPGAWIRLDLKDGTSRTLTIGSVAMASPAFYVRIDDSDTLGLVRDEVVENYFRKETAGWRDQRLMDFRPTEIVSLRLVSGEHRIRVDRSSETGGWRVVEPFPGLADNTILADFLKGLAAMRARSFPDDHPASLVPYGLDPPEGVVTVIDASGTEQRLLLGAVFDQPTGAQRYAARPGRDVVYGVPAAYIGLARRSDMDFRQKSLFPSGLRGVRAIVFTAGSDSARFAPGPDGVWHRDGEARTPGAPPPDRTEFISDLILTVADSIASGPEEEGRTPPALVIELRTAPGSGTRLDVGAPRIAPGGGELWPARFIYSDHNRSGEVFLLGPDLIRPLIALVRE